MTTAQDPTEPKTDFITEAAVRQELGLSPDDLRQLRERLLTPGEHYEPAGKTLRYSSTARDLLRSAVGLPQQTPAEQKNTPADTAALNGAALLKVVRLCANPHILLAQSVDAPDGLVRVRVRSSKNFVPGMELPARLVQDDLYECARPAPRWRGRW